jgi:hypothetical protein
MSAVVTKRTFRPDDRPKRRDLKVFTGKEPRFIKRMKARLRNGDSLVSILNDEHARLDLRVRQNPRLLRGALRDSKAIDRFVSELIEQTKFNSFGGNTLWGVGAEPANLQAACLLFKSPERCQ